eukprot:366472-Chlamydomonas_euryale.AAC.8
MRVDSLWRPRLRPSYLALRRGRCVRHRQQHQRQVAAGPCAGLQAQRLRDMSAHLPLTHRRKRAQQGATLRRVVGALQRRTKVMVHLQYRVWASGS